jgi:hypothetical protein
MILLPAFIPFVNVWLATNVLAIVVYAIVLGSTVDATVPGPVIFPAPRFVSADPFSARNVPPAVMLPAVRFVSDAPLPVKLDAVTPPPTVRLFVIVSLLTANKPFTVTVELNVVELKNVCGAVNVLLELPTFTDSDAITVLVARYTAFDTAAAVAVFK